MKNTIKLFGIIAIMAVIGFSMVSCKMDNDGEMLDGVWDRGDIVITFSGGTAVFTEIKSNSGWASTNVKTGDQKFKNLKKTADLKWTGQARTYDLSTYVLNWDDTTITLSKDGQTLQSYTPSVSNPHTTYTKK